MSTTIIKELKKPLNITDVDFRVQSISVKGYATILAYKDARVDMNRLDEVCGTNWQKRYKTIDGNLYCGVGVKIGDEWIWRWDVGTESFSDKEKGQASDAFKRACFNWGIGRELYNYPFIMVKLNADEFTVEERQGKQVAKQTYSLKLKEWKWCIEVDADGNIASLSAKDQNGSPRYSFPSGNQKPANTPAPESKPAKKEMTEGEASKAISSCQNLKDLEKVWFEIPTTLKPKLLALKNQMKTAILKPQTV